MPSWRYTRCKLCGRHEEEVGPISTRGKCKPCARELVNANLDALVAGVGEQAEHHARRLFMGARKRLMKVGQA